MDVLIVIHGCPTLALANNFQGFRVCEQNEAGMLVNTITNTAIVVTIPVQCFCRKRKKRK